MSNPATENTSSADANHWPWPPDRWTRRIKGVEQILEESIALANDQLQEREEAVKRLPQEPNDQSNAPKGDYYLLPESYQKGVLSYLEKPDSELTRIEMGVGMLKNLEIFLSGLQEASKTPEAPERSSKVPGVIDELQKLFKESARGIFSQSYIYSQLLSHISTDINIVQQALFQRRLDPVENQTTHQGYVLQVGGVLANAALQKVKSSGLLSTHVVPLTYLQNRIDIRLIPYYDVVLISIPYGVMNSDCKWLATDYLAIPHEIGHYLFWWGKIPDGSESEKSNTLMAPDAVQQISIEKKDKRPIIRETLERTTAAEPKWVKTWLEEMFADAVSCLIAGPVSIIGFQELMTSSSPELLQKHFHDDHAHPFPSLRPLIQTALLRKLNHFEKAAAALDKNWNSWVAENWPGLDDPLQHIYSVGDGELLRGDQIIAYLSRTGGPLDQILGTLTALRPENETNCWTGNQSLAEMYHTFTSGDFLKSISVETTVPSRASDSMSTRAMRLEESQVINIGRDSRLMEIFKGWSTEGPHGNDPGI
jgi:hypothetical protein